MPTDPEWSGGTVYRDERTAARRRPRRGAVAGRRGHRRRARLVLAPPRLGGPGLLDRLVGGVGLRRGRRDPDRLAVGDAVDFWRVEASSAGRLLRLRAEMKLPGRPGSSSRSPRASGEARAAPARPVHPPRPARPPLLVGGQPVPRHRVRVDDHQPGPQRGRTAIGPIACSGPLVPAAIGRQQRAAGRRHGPAAAQSAGAIEAKARARSSWALRSSVGRGAHQHVVVGELGPQLAVVVEHPRQGQAARAPAPARAPRSVPNTWSQTGERHPVVGHGVTEVVVEVVLAHPGAYRPRGARRWARACWYS